jgi:hypothetical protein
MSDAKELVFWAGNPQLYLDKQLIELSRDDNRLLDFVEMFTDPDDRYLAYSLFEEKPLLEIALMDERFFEDFVVPHVYDPSTPLYNLYVKSDKSFFIESFAELDYLKELCAYFGFEYVIHGTETNCKL